MDPSGFRTAYEVAGSEGMIEFDSRNSAALRTHKHGGSKLQHSLATEDDPYYKELFGFFESIRNGTPPPVSGYDALMALNLSLCAYESATTGKVVHPKVL